MSRVTLYLLLIWLNRSEMRYCIEVLDVKRAQCSPQAYGRLCYKGVQDAEIMAHAPAHEVAQGSFTVSLSWPPDGEHSCKRKQSLDLVPIATSVNQLHQDKSR